MHYTKTASLLAALASAAQAVNNLVTFQSLDNVDRTVHFTPNAGLRWLESVDVPAGSSVDVHIDDAWIGNFYAVQKGAPQVPGMLGEVAFDGWNGLVYYDVSAIVNPSDVNNVSEMYPMDDPNKPVSGCRNFPCNHAYYLPDDVQTKVTSQSHLVCTLGKNDGSGLQKRDVADYAEEGNLSRDFVLGNFN